MIRKALAFAKWQYPYTLTPEQKARKAQLDKCAKFEHPLPEGSNRELYDVFFAALKEKKAKCMDQSKDYCRSDFHLLGGPDLFVDSSVVSCCATRCQSQTCAFYSSATISPPSWHYRYCQVFIRLGVNFVISPPHSRRLTGPSTQRSWRNAH